MATVGVESLTIWTLNDNLVYDESTCKKYTIDGTTEENGVVKIKISGLSSESTPVYASNVPKLTTSGSPSPKAEVELLDLPLEVQAALLGRTYEKGVMTVTSEYTAPYVAIEMIGNHAGAGNRKDYVAFSKATVALGDVEMDTKEEKAADPKTASVTFTALANDKGEMYALGFDGAEDWNHDEFIKGFLTTTAATLPAGDQSSGAQVDSRTQETKTKSK